ncbi:MAG: hypothetical protein WCK57_02575 [Verrucomicrobiae bacterium]
MSDEPNQTSSPDGKDKPLTKIIWLFCGFVPSVIAIAGLKIAGPGLIPFLLVLNLVSSMVSGLGLIRDIKNKYLAFFLGLFLVLFFLLVNAYIVVFLGCSGAGGRIAP